MAAKKLSHAAPLYLKRVMFGAGISQADLHRAIRIPASTINGIINHNKWPARVNKDEIQTQTEQTLRDWGVDESDISHVWDYDDDDSPLTYADQLQMRRRQQINKPIDRSTFTNEELPENAMLTQQAKQHFKLIHDPFINDIDCSEDLFMSTDQHYVKTAMHQTARRGGFIAVVGESGAGKTTLRRDLLDKITREEPNIRVVFPRIIDKTNINASSICDAILADFDVPPKRTLEAKARQIEKLLAESSRAGNSHTIIIEEAHDMPIQTIKYMKRFWELEDGFKKLISVILVGQPELKMKLNERIHPEVREVSRRCEIIELHPLGINTEKYLELKFKRLNRSLSDIFEPDAFEAIRNRLSVHQGNSRIPTDMTYPLVVNNCVTSAMNSCVELGMEKINAELVRELW